MELKHTPTILKFTLGTTRHYRGEPLDWNNCKIIILCDVLNLQVTKFDKRNFFVTQWFCEPSLEFNHFYFVAHRDAKCLQMRISLFQLPIFSLISVPCIPLLLPYPPCIQLCTILYDFDSENTNHIHQAQNGIKAELYLRIHTKVLKLSANLCVYWCFKHINMPKITSLLASCYSVILLIS